MYSYGGRTMSYQMNEFITKVIIGIVVMTVCSIVFMFFYWLMYEKEYTYNGENAVRCVSDYGQDHDEWIANHDEVSGRGDDRYYEWYWAKNTSVLVKRIPESHLHHVSCNPIRIYLRRPDGSDVTVFEPDIIETE